VSYGDRGEGALEAYGEGGVGGGVHKETGVVWGREEGALDEYGEGEGGGWGPGVEVSLGHDCPRQ
jgi:hypothetical protein